MTKFLVSFQVSLGCLADGARIDIFAIRVPVITPARRRARRLICSDADKISNDNDLFGEGLAGQFITATPPCSHQRVLSPKPDPWGSSQ